MDISSAKVSTHSDNAVESSIEDRHEFMLFGQHCEQSYMLIQGSTCLMEVSFQGGDSTSASLRPSAPVEVCRVHSGQYCFGGV